jgi:phage gpG-like protein
MPVEINDFTEDVLAALNRQMEAGLEAVGQQAVSNAKSNITKAGRVGTTGALRNSITSRTSVAEKAVYVGTNNEYAVYHELGTGKFAEGGKGRNGWWVYVPGSKKKGTNSGKTYTKEQALQIVAILKSKGIDAHMTEGIKPIHFLKNAAQDHSEEYRRIFEQYLKK